MPLLKKACSRKTIFTKMERVPVTVGEGQPHVAFTHIEEKLSVPMPAGAAFDNYVIYIGFDPIGASQDKKKPAPSARGRADAEHHSQSKKAAAQHY